MVSPIDRKIYDKMSSSRNQNDKQEVMLNAMTLSLIAKISISVIEAIKDCKKSEEERKIIAKNPSNQESKILKRIVRKKLGLFKYFFIGSKIVNAMKEVGAEATHEELAQCGLFKTNNKWEEL